MSLVTVLRLGQRLQQPVVPSASQVVCLVHASDGDLRLVRVRGRSVLWSAGQHMIGDPSELAAISAVALHQSGELAVYGDPGRRLGGFVGVPARPLGPWPSLAADDPDVAELAWSSMLWSSRTWFSGVDRLVLGDDGLLALVDASATVVWSAAVPATTAADLAEDARLAPSRPLTFSVLADLINPWSATSAQRATLLAQAASEPAASAAEPDEDRARHREAVRAQLAADNALPAAPAFGGNDTGLLIRTNFTNEAAWQATVGLADVVEVDAEYFEDWAMPTCDDPSYAGLTPMQAVALGLENEGLLYLALADQQTMDDPEHAVLVVDLVEEPGRSFRCLPSHLGPLDTNLMLANMDFYDWAEAVDETDDGVFRGF